MASLGDMLEGEYNDWKRYFNTEPFGYPREEYRWAQTMAVTLSASPKKFDNKVLSADHWRYQVRKPQTIDQQISAARSWAAAFNNK